MKKQFLSLIALSLLLFTLVFDVAASVPRSRMILQEKVSIESVGSNDAPALKYKPGHSIRHLYVAESDTTATPIDATLTAAGALLLPCPAADKGFSIDFAFEANGYPDESEFDSETILYASTTIQRFNGFGADNNARGKI